MERLTKHENGSFGELWAIAWPLMVATSSNSLMILGDRLVLAHYSLAAFNANTGCAPWFWTVTMPLFAIISASNVLTGRFNGARQWDRIGPAVWQMIWLCLAIFFLLLPLSGFLASHLLAANLRELGTPYLQLLLLSAPINLLAFGALGSFYTGRGKTFFISAIALVCNGLNLILDYLLVFGIGPFPEMGMRGAAWATILAQLVAVAIFAAFFFTPTNGKIYGVFRCAFAKKLLDECLHIGLPNAVSNLLNFALWSWILQIIACTVSPENFTAFGIAHTIYVTLFFCVEGTGLAVRSIVSNAYGANNWKAIAKNRRSWFRMGVFLTALLFLCMVLYPVPFVGLFLPQPPSPTFSHAIRWMLFFGWASLAVEGISFPLRQTLIAFGDTTFTMVANILCYGAMVAIPGYFSVKYSRDATIFLAIELVSQMLFALAFQWRLRSPRQQKYWRLASFRMKAGAP
jgi:MATE family multidrug resistance protein